MSLRKLAQEFEMKFWDRITPAMNKSALLQRLIKIVYVVTHSKPGFIAIIFMIWSTIGFLTGLIVARLLLIL